MITVSELISMPTFSNFRLATDRSGLNNVVLNSGMLEWETGKALEDSFRVGDFVITTLSFYRNTPEKIKPVLLTLLKKNISALCIKDIYFKELPSSIIAFANKNHTPIYFFSEAYFDDIIYAIKSSITSGEVNTFKLKKFRELVYTNPEPLTVEMIAREINPYFHNHYSCACWLPRNQEERLQLLEAYENSYHKRISSFDLPPESTHSIVFSPRGIVVIFSDSREDKYIQQGLTYLGDKLELDPKILAMGMSRQYTTLGKLNFALWESFYASVISVIDKTPFSHFDKIGLAKVLCPLHNNYWMSNYYDGIYSLIEDYDNAHNSNLMETIKIYAKCKGNINNTADEMFQHSNTIRHRLEKIMELLNFEDNLESRWQLFVIARFHDIKHIMRQIEL